MNRSFAGQAAVITGASSGIGRSLALALARQGARIGLVARRRAALDEIADEIRKEGGIAFAASADVGDRDQVRSAMADLDRAIGPVDLLVASAGVGVVTTLEPVNIADIEETIRVNLMGVIYAIEAVLPSMLDRKTGHVAAISSLLAYKGMPGESAYCASKAAVNSYLEGLRIQVRDRGIAVTTVCPGYVLTPMTATNEFAMPFVVSADEAARRIVRALRRRAKVYNFPWPTTALIKMARWAPDWAIALAFGRLESPPPPEPRAASPE